MSCEEVGLASFAIWRIIGLFLVEVLILGDRGVDNRKFCVIIRKTVSCCLGELWVLKHKTLSEKAFPS